MGCRAGLFRRFLWRAAIAIGPCIRLRLAGAAGAAGALRAVFTRRRLGFCGSRRGLGCRGGLSDLCRRPARTAARFRRLDQAGVVAAAQIDYFNHCGLLFRAKVARLRSILLAFWPLTALTIPIAVAILLAVAAGLTLAALPLRPVALAALALRPVTLRSLTLATLPAVSAGSVTVLATALLELLLAGLLLGGHLAHRFGQHAGIMLGV